MYTIKDFLEVKSASNPSFSPDGKIISFLSNISGLFQLYITSVSEDEMEQITFSDDPVAFATFCPTRNEVLFGKSVGGNENMQFFLYNLTTKETEALTDALEVRHNFGAWSRDGKYISYAHNGRNGTDFDVYIRDMETGEVETVYDKGGWCAGSHFSPRNSYLVIKKYHSNLNTDFFLYSLKDKTTEHLTPHEGDLYLGGASWFPDESGFYTVTNKDRDFVGLSYLDIKTKKLTYTLTPEWDIDGVTISPDGAFLAAIVNEDGYSKLNVYGLPNFNLVDVSLPSTGLVYSMTFSKDSQYIALVVGDSRNANNIWIYSIKENKYWKVTESPQGIPPEVLVEPDLFRFNSFDGLSVPAFVYLPKNIAAGKKVPVIINIHGGPESQYTPALALLTQYFVYQGYAVVAPNVRGSSGYGKKYLAMDDVEKRLDSVKDLESLHAHITSIPQLDSTRVVLMGGSYGGYMTLAGLAFFPDLWVGGVDIVGISNFITFLENTAPYRRGLREAEYGSLEKDRDLLYKVSPINHIEHIKAPLLVIHGANDPRVPLNEAEQIVDRLNALGRTAELLVYADEGHGLSKLKNRLDAYPKVAQFLEKVFASKEEK